MEAGEKQSAFGKWKANNGALFNSGQRKVNKLNAQIKTLKAKMERNVVKKNEVEQWVTELKEKHIEILRKEVADEETEVADEETRRENKSNILKLQRAQAAEVIAKQQAQKEKKKHYEDKIAGFETTLKGLKDRLTACGRRLAEDNINTFVVTFVWVISLIVIAAVILLDRYETKAKREAMQIGQEWTWEIPSLF